MPRFRPSGRPIRQRLATCAAALTLPFALLVPAVAQDAASCPPAVNLFDALPAPDRERIEAQARDVPNGEGLVFRVEREGIAPSHLFGTMHLSDPRILALPEPVEAAFADSDHLVVETLDIADDQAMAGQLLLRTDLTQVPPGRSLADFVPPDRRDDLEEALQAAGTPLATVRTLQPWFVAVSIAMPACEIARQADGARVLDLHLFDRAEAAGMRLSGLETGTEQLEALASLPLDFQGENLMATLDVADRLPDVFETMIDLYREGRIALIGSAIEAVAPAGTDEAGAAEIFAAFEERVVTARNRTMAERLAPLLEEGGAFVAVGALHLPGEEGLVELLSRDGWTVTRVE